MIRHADVADLGRVADLGQVFFDESGVAGKFNRDHWVGSWGRLMDLGIGILLLSELDNTLAGILGGAIIEDMFTGDLVASELFWFVRPEYRKGMSAVRMLKQFEKTAKQRGARRVTMAGLTNLAPEEVSSLYRRMGYSELERHYVKQLWEQ